MRNNNNNIDQLSKLPKEEREIFFNVLENNLSKHVGVLTKELKENRGVPPKHRIDEIKKFLGED